jgi:type IV fimbrial biogenesis protein FimT
MGTRSGQWRTQRRRGFSLVELMIVLLVMGAILAIGAPSLGDFARNNRLTAAANDFLAVAQAARTEAIKRQRPVSVCASSEPEAANPVCNAGDFTGWIAFEDANANCLREGGEALLRAAGPLNSGVANRSDGVCVSYDATGFTATRAGVAPLSRLIFCDSRGLALQPGTDQSIARGIQISRSGRAQVMRHAVTLGSWELECNTR